MKKLWATMYGITFSNSMGILLLSIVVAAISYFVSKVKKENEKKTPPPPPRSPRKSKLSSAQVKKRFLSYSSKDDLQRERLRLIKLNSNNKASLELIERLYHEALQSLWEKEEKNKTVFSGISTLEELKRKYRKLSKLNHPDHGGSNAAMKKLNELYEEAYKKLETSGAT